MNPVKNPIARAFMYIVLLLFSFYSVAPLLWTGLQSLKTVRQAFARTPQFIFEPTFQNYSKLWLNSTPENFGFLGMVIIGVFVTFVLLLLLGKRLPLPKSLIYFSAIALFMLGLYLIPKVVNTAEFYGYFVNSVIVTIGVVVISMTIGSISGYGLARYTGIHSTIILILALGFRALPRMAFALPYYSFSMATGLYDTYFIVIMVLVAANQPFTIWMMSAFFADIPKELEEAAAIDGLGPFAAFARVIIPSAWPGIISTALFSMLLAYHEFLMVRVLTQSKWTLPVAIVQFTGGESPGHITLAAAAAVSTTIPIVIIIIFFQKHLVKGLTGGSVKG
jgi:ABC-type glycerol-3-phosphate transport system permease component